MISRICLLSSTVAVVLFLTIASTLTDAKEIVYGPHTYWYEAAETDVDIHRNWRTHLIETGTKHFRDSLLDPANVISTRKFISEFKGMNDEERLRITNELETLGVDLDTFEGVRVTSPEQGHAMAEKGKVAVLCSLISCFHDIRPNTYNQHTTKNWQGGHVIKGVSNRGELDCKVEMRVYVPEGAAGGDL